MALYIPTVQKEYMVPAMIDDKAYRALLASGVVDTQMLNVAANGGDYVNVPSIVRAANFGHQTTGTTASTVSTAVDAVTEKAVVLHDYSANNWYKSQLRRIDPALGVKLSQTIGQRIAKRLASQTFSMLDAALQYESLGHSYTTDAGSKISINSLLSAKQKMADYQERISTLVCHSNVWRDLMYDIYTNYKFQGLANEAMAKGLVAEILGISKFIVTDLVPVAAGSASSAGDDIYSSFLLGDNSLALGFQQDPETEVSGVDAGITNQDTVVYTKTTMAYATHLKGMAWNSTANPTDANFATSGNWTGAYQDHRDVEAVRLTNIATKRV